ncbi:hypothetical protein RIF29_09227 [Crotalaria pallida]|uniref:Uncharacterized protein n=1 Tax=Crotalaria pallida TaxID=3830 RepID=A0AAN9FXV9_CROPI
MQGCNEELEGEKEQGEVPADEDQEMDLDMEEEQWMAHRFEEILEDEPEEELEEDEAAPEELEEWWFDPAKATTMDDSVETNSQGCFML